MFNDNFHGLNPHLNYRQVSGGVAPSRHALSKQRYLENKRARLDAEATERRGIAAERVVATALAWLRWMLNAVGARAFVYTAGPKRPLTELGNSVESRG